jgi:TorA maturation chaperone TorD
MTTAIQDAENTTLELSNDELIAECKARANIYRLLSGAFLEEPTVEYLTAIRSPEVMASLKEMGVAFDKDFTDTPIEKLQDELAIEYSVLFVTTGGCPAIESIRLYGRFQQQSFFEVREIYQKAGFRVSGARFMIFDDQLGVELAFLAELLERSAAALAAGNQQDYEQITKEIKRFWALHPGKWVRGYSTLLARATDYSFFREMAKLLGGFAQWELDLLGVKVDDLDGGKLKVPMAEVPYEYDPNEPVCNACEKGRDNAPAEDEVQQIDISQIQARLEGRK